MGRFVIAVTRTCGSGGTTIGRMLAEDYGINMYDRELLRLASDESGISEALFANADERVRNSILYRVSKKVYNGELIPPESNDFTSNENLFNYQAKVLKELAEQESYVCIGRAADYVMQDNPYLISVYLYAAEGVCIGHLMEKMGLSERESAKYIKKMDKYRSEYYRYHTGKAWENVRNYNLCIDTGKIGYKNVIQLIKEYVEFRVKEA